MKKKGRKGFARGDLVFLLISSFISSSSSRSPKQSPFPYPWILLLFFTCVLGYTKNLDRERVCESGKGSERGGASEGVWDCYATQKIKNSTP